MRQITAEDFARLCYLVLLQDISSKAPEYIEAKRHVLNQGYGAISELDDVNAFLVGNYLAMWGYEMPTEVRSGFNWGTLEGLFHV